MCRKIWKIENILTFIEVMILTVGIKMCFDNIIWGSMICLIFLGILDGLDGKFAQKVRKNEENKEYGVQLHSLVDIISSGVFPVIILYSMKFDNMLDVLVYIIFLICGVTRLAFFNVNNKENNEYFYGIPITASAMILPIVYLLTNNEIIYMVCLFLLSILYVSKLKIKKLNLKLKIFLSIIGIIVSAFIFIKGGLG